MMRSSPRAVRCAVPHSTKWWLRRPRPSPEERLSLQAQAFFASFYYDEVLRTMVVDPARVEP